MPRPAIRDCGPPSQGWLAGVLTSMAGVSISVQKGPTISAQTGPGHPVGAGRSGPVLDASAFVAGVDDVAVGVRRSRGAVVILASLNTLGDSANEFVVTITEVRSSSLDHKWNSIWPPDCGNGR